MAHVLVTTAVIEEANGLKAKENYIITGVGKVNAAVSLMTYIHMNGAPDYVVNLGTAGSTRRGKNQILWCDSFKDRDYKGFEFRNYYTAIYFGKTIELDWPRATCHTGDSFLSKPLSMKRFDLVDMEGFALAKVCMEHNIKFMSFKMISDAGSYVQWQKNIDNCADDLAFFYYRKVKPLLEG